MNDCGNAIIRAVVSACMITKIVSRCGNCGYENRFPMDSDDSDAVSRSEIESGKYDGEGLSKLCEDVFGAEETINEIRGLLSEGWILRDISQVCMICPSCAHFGTRIWYSAELRSENKRTFKNNDIVCECGTVMERFDPIAENKRTAAYRCVKCGADNLLDRKFKLKDFD